jgi:hypothetical protein
MIAALQEAVSLEESSIDYLSPLLNIGDAPIRIATLNYDLGVELLAKRAGLDLSTGVSMWTGAFGWEWKAGADIRLLKLHGSVDWYLGSRPVSGRMNEEEIVVTREWRANELMNGELAVIFGQRGKLRARGPFLAMLGGLDDFLVQTKHLVIVGYSFRDDHINTSLRRWFNHSDDPHVTIIDPALHSITPSTARVSHFLQAFLDGMREPGSSPYPWRLGPQHRIIALPAGQGLEERFGRGRILGPSRPTAADAGHEH